MFGCGSFHGGIAFQIVYLPKNIRIKCFSNFTSLFVAKDGVFSVSDSDEVFDCIFNWNKFSFFQLCPRGLPKSTIKGSF